jgi:Bacterial alpha-L-rhamnosidase C-terminal domain/Bacterial alpha-L-rhamnosidase 6 hairpin glycosidase domain
MVTRVLVPGAVTALLTGLAVVPAQATAHHQPNWESYLEQPRTSDVHPVSATVLAGSVANPGALTRAGHGATTLTVTSSGQPATVLLDYGVEVEGSPYLRVRAVHGSTPVGVSLAFSESRTYLRTPPGSGPVTGDSAFQPRSVPLSVTSASTVTSGFMGGFRFEAITLSTPGTIVLSGAGLQFGGGYLATARDYQGYFASSSAGFTTMYYDGAYTEQTDMQPAGTNGATEPSVLDGAKRDRAIWSGDLKIEGQGIADTLGSNGDNYVKQSLLTLITSSEQGGGLNADTLGRTGSYSNSYSSWTLDAAATYYRNTGDTAFAEQVLPWLEGQLAYDATLTDSDGLIATGAQISTTSGGYDWDFYDGAKTGVVTAFNDLYYQSLRDVAYMEANLGHPDRAAAYDQTANRVRDAINARLLNPAAGTYYLSESDHTTFAQDANALSVLFGVAPASRIPGILSALKTLWTPHGSEPFSGTAYSNLISPYVTAYEVEAAYLAGDTGDAERLLHLTWDQMIDPHNPFFTGTMWENIGPDGTATEARTSLSHGWASGPTPIMTSYVLGVQPLDPGYRTFTVVPHPGTLQWAEGAVPTPYGRIFVHWARTGHRLSLTIMVPAHTTAFVELPGGHQVTLPGGAHGAQRTRTG